MASTAVGVNDEQSSAGLRARKQQAPHDSIKSKSENSEETVKEGAEKIMGRTPDGTGEAKRMLSV
jgi:hypothetical protein